jgi:CheY-like chemotaxis protein
MRIVEAVNGAEALAALGREEFDIVLLDMHMPVMDGPTTIGHIRKSDKPWGAIPVIALTADAMSGDKERYLAMGMDGYLSKPLAERDLLAEIARVRAGDAWVPTRKSHAS